MDYHEVFFTDRKKYDLVIKAGKILKPHSLEPLLNPVSLCQFLDIHHEHQLSVNQFDKMNILNTKDPRKPQLTNLYRLLKAYPEYFDSLTKELSKKLGEREFLTLVDLLKITTFPFYLSEGKSTQPRIKSSLSFYGFNHDKNTFQLSVSLLEEVIMARTMKQLLVFLVDRGKSRKIFVDDICYIKFKLQDLYAHSDIEVFWKKLIFAKDNNISFENIHIKSFYDRDIKDEEKISCNSILLEFKIDWFQKKNIFKAGGLMESQDNILKAVWLFLGEYLGIPLL